MAVTLYSLLDAQRQRVAEIEITDTVDEWYYGRLVNDARSETLRRDLDWYDEVVSGQMLSYLDEAAEAVDRHQLSVLFPDGVSHKVYSLHLDRSGEATFRICPVSPPKAKTWENSLGIQDAQVIP